MAVTVVDMPVALPAKCVSCGNPYSQDGRKFVDLHIDVERYGRIYFCTLCMGEVARYINYAPIADFEDDQKMIQKLSDELEGLEYENRELRGICSSLVDRGFVVEGNIVGKDELEELISAVRQHIDDYYAREESTATDSGQREEGTTLRGAEGERDSESGELGSTEQSEGSGPDGVSTAIKIELDSA